MANLLGIRPQKVIIKYLLHHIVPCLICSSHLKYLFFTAYPTTNCQHILLVARSCFAAYGALRASQDANRQVEHAGMSAGSQGLVQLWEQP